jgi:hypothetical protein
LREVSAPSSSRARSSSATVSSTALRCIKRGTPQIAGRTRAHDQLPCAVAT